MPRIAAICATVVVACSFNANYGGGHYKCTDGLCPSGLTCSAGICVAGTTIDAPASGSDAAAHAQTCGDPEPVASAGGTFMGTTTGRVNNVDASCSGGFMNAVDAVYRIDGSAGEHLVISVTGSWSPNAYVIPHAQCMPLPATPACLGSAAGSNGPADVMLVQDGQYDIIVDSMIAASNGSYTLAITH